MPDSEIVIRITQQGPKLFKAVAQRMCDRDKAPADKTYGLWCDASPEYAATNALKEFFANTKGGSFDD